MRSLSSTRGYFERGLWSRMKLAFLLFIPRMPSSRSLRPAVNIHQNMAFPLGVDAVPFLCLR